jgi:hypothetical protein
MYQNFIIPYLYEAQHVLGDTAHHQDPKTALATSGFTYTEGCWTCSWWTSDTTILLNFFYELYYDAGIHERQVHSSRPVVEGCKFYNKQPGTFPIVTPLCCSLG